MRDLTWRRPLCGIKKWESGGGGMMGETTKMSIRAAAETSFKSSVGDSFGDLFNEYTVP